MFTLYQLYKKLSILLLTFLLLLQGVSKAQDVQLDQNQAASNPASSELLSDIEFLVELSQRIIQDKSRLKTLKADSSKQEPVFQKVVFQFYQIDAQLDSIKNLESPPGDLAIREQDWEKLKDGLEFMLKRRRTVHQQIKIVRQKIEKEEEIFALAMKGQASIVMDIAGQGSRQVFTNDLSYPDSVNADTTLFNNDITIDQVDSEYNWRIVEAERELEILKAKFDVARIRWLLLEQLLTINQDDLAVLQAFTSASLKKLNQWKTTINLLENQLEELRASNTTPQLQIVIQNRIDQSLEFIGKVESILAKDSTQIVKLEGRVANLSGLKGPMTEEVAEATKKIMTQNHWLDYLRSPLSPHRLNSLFVNTGPRILLILLFLFLVWAGGRWLIGRILRGLALHRYKSKEDREERVETLSRAIRSGLTIAVLFVGFLSILSELGINVSVLLGGAAVFSLAIAFGAQSLVKDFFTGFMILSENQYRVGNVIKIDNISGVVEDISLRTTILRDLEGVAHFIPHGEITKVSNLTHRWSRVALDIGIAYKENVDQVMEVIMKVAKEMRKAPEFKRLITDEPEMLGVDAFADSAIIIKVLLKTKPLKQWLVKREFLRRLKNRFDELDIEIPFPHRTIYHRDLPVPNR